MLCVVECVVVSCRVVSHTVIGSVSQYGCLTKSSFKNPNYLYM